jgi:hypothetical protein
MATAEVVNALSERPSFLVLEANPDWRPGAEGPRFRLQAVAVQTDSSVSWRDTSCKGCAGDGAVAFIFSICSLATLVVGFRLTLNPRKIEVILCGRSFSIAAIVLATTW